MEISLLIGGFGGQGVQTIGKLLTYAGSDAGCQVTFFPSYGGEMRGGTSNCTVAISNDKPIASPSKKVVDYVVALNAPSFDRFMRQVKPGGTLIANSNLIEAEPPRKDINYLKIPLNSLAEELGSQKVMNVIMLGFISRQFDFIPEPVMKETIKKRLGSKAEFIELNNQAFEAGARYAENLRKC